MRVFDTWLDTLMAMLGPDLLRMKGLVHVDDVDGPFVIHAVQHVFHPPVLLESWPSEDHRTRIVLIGRDISTKLIEQSLAFLRGTASRRRATAVALPGPSANVRSRTGAVR
jgi:G3E family GTPase